MNTSSEETIFLSEYLEELEKSGKKVDIKSIWKPVTIGGVSAIMLGIGVYAIGDMGRDLLYIDENKSFDEAMDEARQELGSDGVFQYKDGVYVACSPEEWDERTDEEKTTVVAHLIPEEYLDIDLSTSDIHDNNTDKIITVDINDNVKPLDVEIQASSNHEQAQNAEVVSHRDEESIQIIESSAKEVDETDVVVVTDNAEKDQPMTDEIEVILVDNNTVEQEEGGIVGKIIEEIAEFFVPESNMSHPSPLEASKAMDIDDVEDSVNPEVAPNMPDYMQDADISSIF